MAANAIGQRAYEHIMKTEETIREFHLFKHKKWNHSVMDHIRRAECTAQLQKGCNEITVWAKDPGVILERILVVPMEKELPYSFLGPRESSFLK